MNALLKRLNIESLNKGATLGGSKGWIDTKGSVLDSISPIDGKVIASVRQTTAGEYDEVVSSAKRTFQKWRMLPAPARGEIVRQIGDKLRENKKELGALVTLEAGKIVAEGEGEVQEMIDIADFSVGLSRQLYGLTTQSERPFHRMYEQWHPYGITGVVTAFNFPVAVWAWNALIAAVCGNTVIWKPSSKTPITAIAVHRIIESVLDRHSLSGVFNLVIGKGEEIGEALICDRRIPLVSATGSTRMGAHVGRKVAQRFGRSILELGGNNAIIICEDADINLALRATLFGAVGTAGQRCTTTRRIIIQKSIKDAFISSLLNAYEQISIGDPRDRKILMGPLIDEKAVSEMMTTISNAQSEGARLLYGGKRLKCIEGGFYVQPCIIEADKGVSVVQKETFAPILYILTYETLDEAIEINNSVPQGLTSAIFTNSMKHAEKFLSAIGSDCGIANVNIGTSGAEIGGAFGGEKETGGGREAGSDSWKAYMRRQTCTINWGEELPLSQGITFQL